MVSRRRVLAVVVWVLGPALITIATPRVTVAQGVELRASVDRPTVSENESFIYVLTLRGQAAGEPDLTPLSQEFEILQRARNTSIQMAGGQTTRVTEWRLQMMPRAAGSFTLPPLVLAGVLSNPVDIQVVPAVAGDTPGGDIFLEVEVTPSIAYVQSQVTFTLRLFRGVSTGRSTLTAPVVTGGEAIVEPFGEDREYQTVRDGRNFVAMERRYAIFPQASGNLTIESLTFEAVAITSSGFSSLQRFRSDPLDLEVRAAVAPPAQYAGATWLPARNLTLSERWSEDADQMTAGVPQTRTLRLEADGVLETQLPELVLTQADGVKQYADQPELSREQGATELRAARTERFAVIAQSPGRLAMPGMELPWFNVEEGSWEVARIESRSVVVVPGQEDPQPQPALVADAQSGNQPAEQTRIWQAVSAALLLAWLATLGLWLRSRSPGGTEPDPATESAPRRTTNQRLLRALRAACSENDGARARTLLLEWGALRVAEAPRSLGMLSAALPEELAGAISELERSLYGPEPAAWQGARLAEAMSGVDAVNRTQGRASDQDLLPLYR